MCKLDLTLPVRTFFLWLFVVLLWLIVNNSLVFFIQIQFDIECVQPFRLFFQLKFSLNCRGHPFLNPLCISSFRIDLSSSGH